MPNVVVAWLLNMVGVIALPLWISCPNVRRRFDGFPGVRPPNVVVGFVKAICPKKRPSRRLMAVRKSQEGGGVVPISKPP